ncbi:MAG: site-2 protease family protein [Candidatus Eremiobacteraeota bacterium]|nr:site-2 protease family protein [Candidatus Eremiobacteraeota bacterium]
MGKVEEDLLKHLQEKQQQRALEEAEKKAKQKFNLKSAAGIGGVAILLLWKFKALIIIVLAKLKFILLGAKFMGLGKVLVTGGSMILSVFAYATIWGFPYALGFVLLILIHEAGHVLALSHYRVKASMPIFIPFVGAFVALKEMPKNVLIEAVTAIAGPVVGSLGAFACYGIYLATDNTLYLSLAWVGYMINLFNLLPVLPLDGGRIAGAISPRLWIVGLVVFAIFFFIHPSLILIILVLLSLPRVIASFRLSPGEADYFKLTPAQRTGLTLAYFALGAVLALLAAQTHTVLQGIISLKGNQ